MLARISSATASFCAISVGAAATGAAGLTGPALPCNLPKVLGPPADF